MTNQIITLIFVGIFFALPYLAIVFVRGLIHLLREISRLKREKELLFGESVLPPSLETHPSDTRMKRELDKIEKDITGKVTKIKTPSAAPGEQSLGKGSWVDSPTPKEEELEAQRELESAQQRLKETIANEEESKVN